MLIFLALACDAETIDSETTDPVPVETDDGSPGISHWMDEGLAVDGYDTVAYFTEGAATLGDAAITADWGGAEWRFASEENRDAFEADPTAYAPQYGAYCSWAMADDRLATTDATAWDILDGKLYLNYSAAVREKWLEDTAGFIDAADGNWSARLGE